MNRGEYEAAIMAVASPVMLDGRACASLVIQLPAFRHEPAELDEAGAAVSEAAGRASMRLSRA